MRAKQQWRVNCQDTEGQRRGMSVRVDHGEVVVVTPSGELTLEPMEVGRLRAALRSAVLTAASSGEPN